MALTDLGLEELSAYRPHFQAPPDFDGFWEQTLSAARSHDLDARFAAVEETGLVAADVFDVRFAGWDGQPIAAWLVLPRHVEGPLAAVVQFQGYSGGRGLAVENLWWSAFGYAHLVVDSRGQGQDTPDAGSDEPRGSWVEGLMTKGIDDPATYYYRRLITDCVRAVEAVKAHPRVDGSRVVVAGVSQGGGLALAVAGLLGGGVAGVLSDVPFLCSYRRGCDVATDGPYVELVDYLARHTREDPDRVFRTLSYFDGVHFAPRASAPALFSVGLMDPICPSSTVWAAYSRYGGDAEIRVWPFAGHSGGQVSQAREQLAWLRARGLAPGAGGRDPAPGAAAATAACDREGAQR